MALATLHQLYCFRAGRGSRADAGTDATRPAMFTIISGFGILISGMMIMRIRQVKAEKQLKLVKVANHA